VNPNVPVVMRDDIERAQTAARRLGLEIIIVKGGNENEIERAFATAAQERASALQVGDDAFLDGRRERIAALGLRHALPTMSLTREAAAAGSLMSYGSDRLDVYRPARIRLIADAMLCPTISLDSRAPLLRAWRCRCVTTTLH
jgi:putative ABC transport system substrate-binding protein